MTTATALRQRRRPRCLLPLLLLVLATAAGKTAAYEYLVGANAHWMPTAAATGDTGSVDAALDGLQRLGARIVRSWAFARGVPAAPGRYDQAELKGIDYFVAGAARRGMRVILALGNFWAAYKGPEEYVDWAKGGAGASGSGGNSSSSATGAGEQWLGDVRDFYRSPAVRQLYKDHLSYMLGRTNQISGLPYASDPAIFAFDVLNEPRCPGCDAGALAEHLSWLGEMSGHLKGLVKGGALVLAGTEGFFTPQASASDLVATNPGAGAGCEGEDVVQIASLGAVGGMTAHLYWRHSEQLAELGWQKPGFDLYADQLHRKIGLYTDLAGGLGRPLIAEEFGLTRRFFDEAQRKVIFAVVFSRLVEAKRGGRAFSAALFWNAAHPSGGPDYGGYDVDVTKAPSGATVGLGGPPPAPGGGTTGGGGGAASNASSPSPSPSGSSPSPSPPPISGRRRRLSQVVVTPGDDELDAFRRGPARKACAEAAAAAWRFSFPPKAVDTAAWLGRVGGADVVDIVAEAAALLK